MLPVHRVRQLSLGTRRSRGHSPFVASTAAWAAGGAMFPPSPNSSATTCRRSSAVRRASTREETTSREHPRYKDGVEPCTGQQVGLIESPDMTPVIQFHGNVLQHVKVPEVATAERTQSDIERNRRMEARYGKDGPGDRLVKNVQATKRDMLQTQQDIDGLPWETRWKKTLIPTHEEIIQDLRDRFELFEPDAIEREQQWFLHWRDRLYKSQKDRLIWPQGYTDYLDHYDDTGRRRTLPSDQRWSDVSWKHLADTNYRDRMWMVENEERKAVHATMDDPKQLLLEAESKGNQEADIFMAIQYGVVDISPDQAYEALSGTADPREIAKTKFRVEEYGAEFGWKIAQGKDLAKEGVEMDPITGLPKSDRPPLPTGVTVEQGVAIEMQTHSLDQQMQDRAAMMSDLGGHGINEYGKQHLEMSRAAGDKPGLLNMSQQLVEEMREKQARLASQKLPTEAGGNATAGGSTATSLAATRTTKMMNRVESAMTDAAVESNLPATPSGYLKVPKRPPHVEPSVPPDMYHKPDHDDLQGMPEWYRKSAVDTGEMIHSYGMTNDPLETQTLASRPEYYQKPKQTSETLVVHDITTQGESSFDEGKIFRQKTMPEASIGEYRNLPTFSEVKRQRKLKPATNAAADAATTTTTTTAATLLSDNTLPAPVSSAAGAADTALLAPETTTSSATKSQQLADERRRRSQKQQFDPDLLLPELPWETDAIIDPYRGVAETDAVDFNKKDVEKTFKAYRDFMQQTLVEFTNLSTQVTEDRCEKMLRDAMEKVRRGHVGEHPSVPEPQLEVIQIMFQGHIKQFMADWMNFRGRKQDSQVAKSEADDMMRKSSAKCKLLGPSFTSFIQEMTALELENVRRNPVQRHVICLRDRKHEVIAKPFMKWISNELTEYIRTDWLSWEQMDTHRTYALRHLNEARFKSPSRLEGCSDRTRDMLVEAFHAWCRGALAFHTGKHLFSMFQRLADTRFRSRAEDFFEESFELFQSYNNAAEECGVFIPIPHSEPYYDFADSEYNEGENGYQAELSGKLDKAERIWHSGTTIRWWPLFDETDFLHFYERRGRISQAYDISDRCLENMNKRTHPSIHPFPERAKQWLEGAPLTQETAEHLWLRYMGDLYVEHADFCNRTGKSQTAREHMDHAMNFYAIALKQAKERLPESWKAPLLTRAKLLLRCLGNNSDVREYIQEVETVADQIAALRPVPNHWVDRLTQMPMRIALIFHAAPAYAKIVVDEAQEIANMTVDNQTLVGAMETKNKTGKGPEDLSRLEDCIDIVAEKWRAKVLRWQAREQPASDGFHLCNVLYFLVRVRPKTPAEVDEYFARFWPTFEYLNTQTALAARPRARLFQEAVRRLCQILLPGSKAHQDRLLKELRRLAEVMRHALDPKELDRTIKTLELHMADPAKSPYIYGTETMHKGAAMAHAQASNPVLQVRHGAKDYEEMKNKERMTRAAGEAGASGGGGPRSPSSMDDTHHAERRSPSTRDLSASSDEA